MRNLRSIINAFTLGCGWILLVMTFCIFVSLLIIKLVWSWVIPDLFPKMVEQGMIVKDLTWWMSFKLAILIGVLFGWIGSRTSGKSN